VQSKATTVEEYMRELPKECREVISKVRETILENLPDGYSESMNWGMISYEIPLEMYPETYNGQPLAYAALAAQKHYYSLYLMGVYQDPNQESKLRESFKKAGKRLDIGKSCVRFRKLEDIPLDVIGDLIAVISPEQMIAMYEETRKK
jgi:hypothetical protein